MLCSFGRYRQFAEFGEDGGGRRRPDEGTRRCVAPIEVWLVAVCRIPTEWKLPRHPLVREAEKNISTALSQERDVGVKWKVQRGCRVSQVITFGCLLVA